MVSRTARVKRATKETSVDVALRLDRPGRTVIATTIPFLDHMLDLFAHHAGVGLDLKASGDTHIDDHHLVEDIGITLGQALEKALGKRAGIARYGNFLLPMDESLSYVALDLSGRPFLDYDVRFRPSRAGFDFALLKEFFYALAANSRMTLHLRLVKGDNNHHIAESLFKGFGRALGQADRSSGKNVPSTKGTLTK